MQTQWGRFTYQRAAAQGFLVKPRAWEVVDTADGMVIHVVDTAKEARELAKHLAKARE